MQQEVDAVQALEARADALEEETVAAEAEVAAPADPVPVPPEEAKEIMHWLLFS